MLTLDSEKTRPELSHTTTVNRAALSAWLRAWTTGTSFPAAVPITVPEPSPAPKGLLARFRHDLQPKSSVE